MKFCVETVEIGASYEETVYDFWVTGKLESGQLIKIFDMVPFDLRDNIGKTVNGLILAGFIKMGVENEEGVEIAGNFLKEYEIPKKVIRLRQDVYKKKWLGFQTNDGFLILNPAEFEEVDLEYGEEVRINVGRFDLVGIL